MQLDSLRIEVDELSRMRVENKKELEEKGEDLKHY
jgi:hypothetical protein